MMTTPLRVVRSPGSRHADHSVHELSSPVAGPSTSPLHSAIDSDDSFDFRMLDMPEVVSLPWVPLDSRETRVYIPSSVHQLVNNMKHELEMEGRARRKAEDLHLEELRKRVKLEVIMDSLRNDCARLVSSPTFSTVSPSLPSFTGPPLHSPTVPDMISSNQNSSAIEQHKGKSQTDDTAPVPNLDQTTEPSIGGGQSDSMSQQNDGTASQHSPISSPTPSTPSKAQRLLAVIQDNINRLVPSAPHDENGDALADSNHVPSSSIS
ncbi:hypothetical protein SERLA73DRAFT_175785 [Serpula lacrymans var. lacrymans S7.3]|uniref:Uncharacterized protein n=2 Tax=Serpula lacrymans var. lacrymans TaxID=341189 RepID=F8PIV3_SERL3|nr:uncharacterized protein SERLADRAFT_458383 [Serpula lacrymans var. lacrymans S7.9]EGO04053.1 hypothetical protein SERLA73DRAFT_175785 [Serpula lacrymans var. lacrymans S7.3]EGO29968.1 hypothetical protein SERLADRAFT_458383 [Serpula lacrymans var. lacrymans S7.9]